MLVNEINSLIIHPRDHNCELYNKKVKLLGVRKSIIVCHIIDSLYESLVCIYLTPYYIINSFLYSLLFYFTIKFYRNIVPIYLFTCTIKFAIKVTMFFILKYWMLNVLNTFFVIFNLFYIKVVFKFFTILNEELNDSNIESLISGWRPRRIHFVY